MAWRRADLHLHTPASTDYQDADTTFLDILRQAEERGLDIIAFTDHNSVRGYADLWREIEDLELLEYLGRMTPEEEGRLAEYRRLLDSLLLLPGFEFTATFGFHILAIFPQRTSVRMMEHVLLTLGVPEEKFGSSEVGATSDVLTAYRILHQHGALVIGAHVNSTNGIAMQGLRFGGQTKIAYTQDPHLHALEVTDLDSQSRRATAHFFSGIKPEYPRRMHCIQGSDAHRLERDPQRESALGVGDRATELLLPETSFDALRALFESDDFDRSRPYVPVDTAAAQLQAARAEGNTAVQSFHERLSTKRGGASHVLRDIVAFANSEGGTIFVGASPFEKRPVVGVEEAAHAADELLSAIATQITPGLAIAPEVLTIAGKELLQVTVPKGDDRPYALAPGEIYVRRDAESALATRDEIVAMVRGTIAPQPAKTGNGTGNGHGEEGTADQMAELAVVARPAPPQNNGAANEDDLVPRTGVEIVGVEDAAGEPHYALRDLRNGEITRDVTRDTGRRLWRYAIQQYEAHAADTTAIHWAGDLGWWKGYKPRGGDQRYNLASRENGVLRVFYGVTEDGMDERWREVLAAARR